MQNKPKIVVFSTPTCPWCTRVKVYLKKNGFTYRDIDVSKDQRAAQDLVRKTGQMGVPVTMINNRPIVGFDKRKIDTLLKI